MALGISPTVDYAFKRLFGDPRHTTVVVHLLNAIFENQFVVDDVEILTPFLDKEFDEDKLSILDLRVRDTVGRQYNLEMQTAITDALPSRLVYYLASMYCDQLGESDAYSDLAPAIGICFLDQVLFRDVPGFHTRFRLCSLERRLVFTDQLEIHLLELPKYSGATTDLIEARPVEKWAYFMRHAAEMDVQDIGRLFQDAAFLEAGGILEMISRTQQERLRYELRLKALRDHRWSLESAERRGLAAGREQGRQEGIEQGLEQGREQGLEQGLEQGREQGLEQGRERGVWIGKVQTLQDLLGVPVTEAADLATWDVERLKELAETLRTRLRARTS